MQNHAQAIITVLSLVNPVMCGAMFAQIESGNAPRAKLADATKAALAVLVILSLAALGGQEVLHLFGVSLDAFSVAGGGILAWIGFSMLKGKTTNDGSALDSDAKDDNETHGNASDASSLTPLILFAASPGTITGVITLAVAHNRDGIPITALVAVGVAAAAMWAVMLLVARTGRGGGGGFVRDTATRFMGLIVIAMGVQFALTGARDFMAA